MALVRPEVVEKALASLADAGMAAMTRLDVYATGLAENASCCTGQATISPRPALLMLADDDRVDATCQDHRHQRWAAAGSSSPWSGAARTIPLGEP